jgi:hypothetical protein
MKLIYEMYCVKELEDVLCALEKIGRHDFSPPAFRRPIGKYTIITLPNWQLLFFILMRS